MTSRQIYQGPANLFPANFFGAAVFWPSLICALLLLSSCSPPLQASQEVDASTATLEWLDKRHGLVRKPALQALLRKITKRLSSSLHGQATEPSFELGTDSLPARETIGYKNYPWHVLVINSKAPNAFSLGAGVIVLTKGMIRETRTEAELASVIAHEMAHQLLGHTQAALKNSLEESHDAPHAVFSLEDEIEADRVGLKLLDVGRYDVRHAVFALSIAYRSLDEFVATHDPTWLHQRLARMHQELGNFRSTYPATASSREFNKVRRHL